MMRLFALTVAATIMCAPSGVLACVYPPPPPHEAGETDAAYDARVLAEINGHIAAAARKTESVYAASAKSVFLARIVRSEEMQVDGSHLARQATLRPLAAVRGKLPAGQVTIRDRELTSCGFGGDGPATWGRVGHIVIVFAGVENEGMSFHSNLYAIMADDAQDPSLVAAWSRWKAHTPEAFNQ